MYGSFSEEVEVPLIDPDDVENFNRNEREKEAFFIFTIFVAGKTAKVICEKSRYFHKSLIDYMRINRPDLIPRKEDGVLKNLGEIPHSYILDSLKTYKIGKYGLYSKLFNCIKSMDFDINKLSIEKIENLPGIGKKTSRYFMLYTFREHPEVAILDRHILTYLRNLGYETPKNTPSGKKYDKFERIFLEEYHKSGFIGGLSEFDLEIWKRKGNLIL